MTIHLPKDVESSIEAAVHSGHFASVDDAMTEAARRLLRELKQDQARQPGNATTGHAEEEPSGQELQRRLFNAGVLSEIKPPITDLTPYQNRQAVPIQGEPLSETVIRERR
jgi:Arc/MetJ-type ribon-helix-helix transcriptional regulator